MTPAEAAVVLALASTFDGREQSEAAARAWAEVLVDVPRDEALAAVKDWYRRDRRRIMPSDVADYCRALRVARLEGALLPPPPVDPDDGPAYLQAVRDQTAGAASADPRRELES